MTRIVRLRENFRAQIAFYMDYDCVITIISCSFARKADFCETQKLGRSLVRILKKCRRRYESFLQTNGSSHSSDQPRISAAQPRCACPTHATDQSEQRKPFPPLPATNNGLTPRYDEASFYLCNTIECRETVRFFPRTRFVPTRKLTLFPFFPALF